MNINVILKSFDAQCDYIISQLHSNDQKKQVLLFNNEVYSMINEYDLNYTYTLLKNSPKLNEINRQMTILFIDIIDCERKKYD